MHSRAEATALAQQIAALAGQTADDCTEVTITAGGDIVLTTVAPGTSVNYSGFVLRPETATKYPSVETAEEYKQEFENRRDREADQQALLSDPENG